MASDYRYGYTAEEKAELWKRFRQGQSFREIDKAFNKVHGSSRMAIGYHGGFLRPSRKRAPNQLSLAERESISRGLACNLSLRAIAVSLGRSPSTISREVKRHGGSKKYRAIQADKRAWKNARRPK